MFPSKDQVGLDCEPLEESGFLTASSSSLMRDLCISDKEVLKGDFSLTAEETRQTYFQVLETAAQPDDAVATITCKRKNTFHMEQIVGGLLTVRLFDLASSLGQTIHISARRAYNRNNSASLSHNVSSSPGIGYTLLLGINPVLLQSILVVEWVHSPGHSLPIVSLAICAEFSSAGSRPRIVSVDWGSRTSSCNARFRFPKGMVDRLRRC